VDVSDSCVSAAVVDSDEGAEESEEEEEDADSVTPSSLDDDEDDEEEDEAADADDSDGALIVCISIPTLVSFAGVSVSAGALAADLARSPPVSSCALSPSCALAFSSAA
jgi:hypothetical protein